MPGILPMKVIKVGLNAQTRIAQACDRCRSKKIRCDGVRPCCSQCSSVGFECKTSDKLSRRAFPRGYTESLEERVRALEGEVRELKDLLDEKDEKIDMLSRLHSQSSASGFHHSPQRMSLSPSAISPDHISPTATREDTFQVLQSPYLEGEGAMSHFAGMSSSKALFDALTQKTRETGRVTPNVATEKLLAGGAHIQTRDPSEVIVWKAPPRLDSDKMIGVFFQEWAPLFPVLHRPSFLETYQQYIQAPESITDNCSHAQLNLVFGLAALSTGTRDSVELQSIETQWQTAIGRILSDYSLPTLQCLILAQLYCIQRGDYDKLLMYKALAISLSSRLGLHQSQRRFALGTLTCEIRKKAFWTLYTIDCFTAVSLGLPRLLKDNDVHCEYPVDADEEYIEESGFKAPCPGEFTRLSSALALFRAARILARTLEEVYPAVPSYELSLQKLAALSDDLDYWQQSLAPHLRLAFANEKISVGVTSSRSPLLSLTYHYIRALIHRPAMIAGIGDRASSSCLALASSCKHSIQIVELLEERNLGFSFCVNRDELVVLSGLGLLYQSLDLDDNSKLYKDSQKTVAFASNILATSASPGAAEFSKMATKLLPFSPPVAKKKQHRHNSDSDLPTPNFLNISPSKKSKLQKAAQRLGLNMDGRRATLPNLAMHPHHTNASSSQPDLSPLTAPAMLSRSEPAQSPSTHPMFTPTPTTTNSARPSLPPSGRLPKINLDYLSFSNAPTRAQSPNPMESAAVANPHPHIKTEPTDWERLLGSIDGSHTNIFDNIYGGPAVELATMGKSENSSLTPPSLLSLSSSNPLVVKASSSALDSLDWNQSGDVQWALNSYVDGGTTTMQNLSPLGDLRGGSGAAESVFSLSDEGSTGEELFSAAGGSGNDWGSVSSQNEAFVGIVMPSEFGCGADEGMSGGWDSGAITI